MAKKNIINFTITNLYNLPLPVKGSRPYYHDTQVNGLCLRINYTGVISFLVNRRVNGRPTKITLGSFPAMTIQQARTEAQKTLGVIGDGVNPNKLKHVALKKRNITLSICIEDYIKKRGSNLRVNYVKDLKNTSNQYLDDWLKLPLSDITRDMITARHHAMSFGLLGFASSPSRANTTMRHLRAFFRFAMGNYEDENNEPLFVHNPVEILSFNKSWNREKRRQGVVKNYDLKKWYEGVMELPLLSSNSKGVNSSEVARDLLIFILFTGLRRDEALSLKWDDIDFNNHSLTIEDTKNHETHSIPLTSVLLEVLERRKRDKHNPVINPYDNPYVFQGTKVNSHLTPPKKQIEKAREIIGFHFTLHDLRRTFITTAESLDLPQYTLKKLLNHKDTRDVTGGYIITDMERLREPMQRITDELWSHIND